jgi:hypothetical protein
MEHLEKPIVIKGAGDGEAIFDGNGCHGFSISWPPTTIILKASRFGILTLQFSQAQRRAGEFRTSGSELPDGRRRHRYHH